MTDTAAAFRASYADWKLIKTRSVIQIVLEVPIEQADRAYQVLGGMPSPGAETWCAIARLNEGVTVAPISPVEAAGLCGESLDRPHSPRKPVAADKRLATQSAMRCDEPIFWAFLREREKMSVNDKDSAARAVREYCGVNSRADIKPDTEAGTHWEELNGRYLAWKLVDA